jgi:hypothetical protein
MNNDKVVQFPKHKIVREAPVDIEALTKAKEKGIQNFADSVTNDIIGYVIGDLENYGIDVESEQFIKDFSLTADSLRATVYRTFELQHNLHDFIDNNLTITTRELDE